MRWKSCIVRSAPLIIVLISVATCAACGPETQRGKLVGVKASFGLGEAMQGEVQDIDFLGVVIVELDDGIRVEARVDKALAEQLRGGDMIVIERVEGEGEEAWRVVEILAVQ
jgi:hypothetical protein